MLYTKYFSQINKENGLQRISNYQLGRIMNIVFIEGKLMGVQQSSKTFKENINTQGIELLKFELHKRITELTGNKAPNALLEEICYLSEKECSLCAITSNKPEEIVSTLNHLLMLTCGLTQYQHIIM